MSVTDESDDDVLGEFEDMNGDLSHDTQDFKVVSKSEFICDLNKKVGQLSDIIDQPPDVVGTMLRYFDWNEKKTADKFWNSTQPCNFFALAKLVPPEIMLPEPVFKECAICCDEADLVGFSCFDLFCASCWKGHIKTKISEGVLSVPCLEPECDLMPSDGFIKSMICDDEQSMDAYHELIINSYIANEKHVKWCPAPNCQFVIIVETINCQSIKCNCGHNFCFKCCKECHEPVNCSLLDEWIKEYELALDEKEFSLWSGSVDSKECPRCKSPIEKDGGCHHMTCRKPGCTKEFCWLCLKDWSHSHVCNQYEQEKIAADRASEVEKIRANHNRYKHFYERYKNHQIELNRNNTVLNSKSDKAYNSMIESRRTLMNTYIFAFYLVDGQLNNEIFQHNQKELEIETENLRAILNKEHPKAFEIEQQCCLVDSLRNNLLRHCYEGTQNDEWVFSEKGATAILGTM